MDPAISEEELSVKGKPWIRLGSWTKAFLDLSGESLSDLIGFAYVLHQTCTLPCLHLLTCRCLVVLIHIQDISAYSWGTFAAAVILTDKECDVFSKLQYYLGKKLYLFPIMYEKYCSNVLAITTLEKNRSDGMKKVLCKKCRKAVSSTVLGAKNYEKKYLKYIYRIGGI